MAYRVIRDGVVIEADSVEDVQALVAALATPLPPSSPQARRVKPPKPAARTPKRVRGGSDGALDGRIIEVLTERGPLSPGALTDAVKSDRYRVGLALAMLEQNGTVSVEGATTKRMVTLLKRKAA